MAFASRDVMESVSGMVAILRSGPDGRFAVEAVNAAWERASGRPASEVLGLSPEHLFPPGSTASVIDRIRECVQTGSTVSVEPETSSSHTFGGATLVPVVDSDGETRRVVCVFRDAARPSLSQQTLARGGRFVHALVDKSYDGVALLNADGLITYVSPSTKRLLGWDIAELVGFHSLKYFHPDDELRTRQLLESIMGRSAASFTNLSRVRHKDGSWRYVEGTVTNLLDEPSVEAIVVNFRDVTTRRVVQDAIHNSVTGLSGLSGEAFFRALVRYIADALGAAHVFVGELVEISRERVRTVAVWNDGAPGENYEYDLEGTPCEQVVARDVCSFATNVASLFPSDTLLREMQAESYVGTPLRDTNGRPTGVLVALDRRPQSDPSLARALLSMFAARAGAELERLQAEERLRRSEGQFRQLANNIREVFWLGELTPEGMRPIYVSPGVERVWGRSREELGADMEAWLDTLHPDDRARVRDWLDRRASQRESEIEYRVVRPDGSVRWVHDRAFIISESGGRPFRMAGLAEDITDRKELEEQLHHAHKLEAVGRLAGGVAHDFNNLLTVITGFNGLLLDSLPLDDPRREDAVEVAKAARQAGELTNQLLSFGRKQRLAPAVLDLNAFVLDAEKMLCRLIGEDIRLVTDLQPEVGQVHADRGQLHQVLLNLAINARDAMPQGGKLTIATSELTVPSTSAVAPPELGPGEYIVITVSDTGSGIPEELRSRLFDAFFTTKQAGRGTGLGLSTVRSIVAQAGGHVTVDSVVGHGATFRVYLPRVMDDQPNDYEHYPESRWPRGTETILLAEDQDDVRAFTRFVLTRAGYKVLEARGGDEALSLSARHDGPIDLLITDVVMPGVSGRALADRVVADRPNVRVLMVSGHADEAIARYGVDESKAPLLHKPFGPHAVVTKVREVLDGQV
jgi:two-component system, cell cycle sensor histidine kinase and response regulator CckA